MPAPQTRPRLSKAQRALLASLYAEVRHLKHPGSLSIECQAAEKPVARTLSRRGYLLIHDDSSPDRSIEVFLTAAGIAAALTDLQQRCAELADTVRSQD